MAIAMAFVRGAPLLSGLIAAIIWAGSSTPTAASRPALTGDAAVVERFQCFRCHSAPERLAPATREQSCVSCHRAILAGELDGAYDEADLARWRAHLNSLLLVPSLDGLERRVTPEWMRSFLFTPHDLRPNLPASMPRLRVTEEEAAAIVRHFIPDATRWEAEPEEASLLGDRARGRERYEALGCGACHVFGGASTDGPTTLTDAARLAPDLARTRERMTRAMVVRWLRAPSEINRESRMPTVPMAEQDRADLASFVLQEPLLEPAPAPPFTRLPILDRPVSHAEVDAAVFHRNCRHCHAEAVRAGGDGGPGNTGGFGFGRRGLDLSSYGAIDAARGELFALDESGLPLLVGALVRRHAEVGGALAERRGMPLGLPPLSPEDVQLVESWVAQGGPPK